MAENPQKPKRKPLWRRILARVIPLLIVAGSAVAVVVVIKRIPPSANDAPPARSPVVNVTVETVRALPSFDDEFEIPAVVEPNEVVRISAEEAARVESYGLRPAEMVYQGRTLPKGQPICEGELVAAGQPLMQLNRDLLQAQYAQAEAQQQFDAAEVARFRELRQRNVATDKELEDVLTRLKVSQAALEAAKTRLDRCVIYSPMAGVLNRLPVKVGEFVAPGTAVAEIVDVDTVKVAVDVPERDIGYLRLNDAVRVAPAYADRSPFVGRISYISAVAEAATRTTRVEVKAPNRDRRLRSGQIVSVWLRRQSLSDVVMVPLAAVIPLERGKMVFVERDGRAEARQIDIQITMIRSRGSLRSTGILPVSTTGVPPVPGTPGAGVPRTTAETAVGHTGETPVLPETPATPLPDEPMVRVLAGLASGDRLIVDGHRFCAPGQQVRVVQERQP